ncbi:MAG: sulfatase-like hydrolase/transferase [Kiloniellales bacterium]|nr:sulfatase-like hydrolase/transferase [Kiloniellales bacterium]
MRIDVLAKGALAKLRQAEPPSSVSNRRFLVGCAEFFLWLSGFGLFLFLAETGINQRAVAGLTIIVLYCVLLVVTRRSRLSVAITLMLTLTVWAVSKAKMAYLGTPLVFGDLVNMVGYNLWWVLSQYSLLAAATGVGITAFVTLLGWLVTRRGKRLSIVTVCAAVVVAVYLVSPISRLSRTVYFWDQNFDNTAAALSTFTASAVWWWGSGGNVVTIYDVADQPLGDPLGSAEETSLGPKPNIFMVLDESVFDPRVLGLPIEDEVAEYFQPSGGLSGSLSVNVHGGGTWVSEFAVMSGLDTRIFGDKAYYLSTLMEKRLHHSLIHVLKSQGYKTIVVYCVNGSFMNAENFYRSIGVQEFFVPTQAADKRHLRNFRDSELYDYALERMSLTAGTEGDGPVFVLVATISNHGPHSFNRVPEDAFPDSRDWLARNVQDPDLQEYHEYYLRLRQSFEDYRNLKSELASRYKRRPTLLVRFGDHHPKFTKGLEFPDRSVPRSSLFATYFAIEAINGDLAARPEWGSGPLDIAYLSTVVLDSAGLAKDQIFETRKRLMESCAGRYFECRDALKARLHRTLLDRGYLEVDRVELAEIDSKPEFHP